MRHGKSWDHRQGMPAQQFMEGRFDRLFADLPTAAFDDADLAKLATAMTSDEEGSPTPEGTSDPEENPGITAGYTYLGQFIDHDITFDPISALDHRADIKDLADFRTPRLDLDNLYGRGPGDNPFLYDDATGKRILLGAPLSGNSRDPQARDLQRSPPGRALIGDPRNDENRIVAQLQATMIRFHNRMADVLGDGAAFTNIRDQVRWHYQWMLVNDFLPTIVNRATIESVFPHLGTGAAVTADKPVITIEKLKSARFLIPVEFTVAAYRFGHSMIRPIYRLNEVISRRPIFSAESDPAADLGGMRPIPSDWAIDWQFFFDIGDGSPNPDQLDDRITRVPQRAYKIDTSLVSPLGALPASVAANPSSLALRNLIRGRDFALPSGQDIAGLLGEETIDVIIGKATKDDPQTAIADIAAVFADEAPLWTYILAEAKVSSWARSGAANKDEIPISLGPVGGRIVAETFAAMLVTDPTSLLNAGTDFSPRSEFATGGKFGIAELIRAARGH